MLWNGKVSLIHSSFEWESDLEEAIQKVNGKLLIPNSIYLKTKRRIGPKGGRQNIPDAT